MRSDATHRPTTKQWHRLKTWHTDFAWIHFQVFSGLETIEGRAEKYQLFISPHAYRNASGTTAREHAVTITLDWSTVLACKTPAQYIDLLETEIAIARVTA